MNDKCKNCNHSVAKVLSGKSTYRTVLHRKHSYLTPEGIRFSTKYRILCWDCNCEKPK